MPLNSHFLNHDCFYCFTIFSLFVLLLLFVDDKIDMARRVILLSVLIIVNLRLLGLIED